MPQLDTLFGASSKGAVQEVAAEERVEKPQVTRLRNSTRDMNQAPSLQSSMMAELSKSLRSRNAKASIGEGVGPGSGSGSESGSESPAEIKPKRPTPRKLAERPSKGRGGGGGGGGNPLMAERSRRFGRGGEEEDGAGPAPVAVQAERTEAAKKRSPAKKKEGASNPFLAELQRKFIAADSESD